MRTGALLLFLSAFCARCASTLTPTGGPRDSLPPVVVAMTPADGALRMKDGSRIYIEFDEFIQLKDQQKEFYTSPPMKYRPTLTMRGRGVVVQLRDTMHPNTTYALNFGSTVCDNNEGNPLHALRYVFSTGDEIDSMYMSGYTADSYRADSVSKSFIWFYVADSLPETPGYDSTLFLREPHVVARAENNGIFIAQNLKPVPYRVYAVEDRNGNQTYDPAVDQVGFLEGTYNPAEQPDFAIWYDSVRRYPTAEPQLYIRMFTDRAFRRQMLAQSERPLQHKAVLYFNAARPEISELRFDSIPADRVIVEPLTEGRDTLALWFNLPSAELPDTIRGTVTYLKHDSLNVLRPETEELKLAWRLVETREQERERERQERERARAEAAGEEYTPPEQENPFAFKLPLSGEVNPERHLTAEFDYPLVRADSSALHLTRTDAEGVTTDVPVRFVRDTASMHRWRIEARWETGGEYALTIPEGALTDVAGCSNDSITGSYKVMDPEQFAVVKCLVQSPGEGMRYIVQLLDAGDRLIEERRGVTEGPVQFNYVEPGEIKLRVVEDANANGRWDTGDLVARRQPERSELYRNDAGEEIFTTKANWEFEVTLDMGRLFAPVTMESLVRLLDERETQRLRKEDEARREAAARQSGQQQSGGFGLGSMGGMI